MKCVSIWMATVMAVFRGYSQNSQTTAVQVNSQAPTYLYGGQASKLEGDVKRRGGDNFAWKGSGAVTYDVEGADCQVWRIRGESLPRRRTQCRRTGTPNREQWRPTELYFAKHRRCVSRQHGL